MYLQKYLEKSAQKFKGKIAVNYNNNSITYDSLNKNSNKIAYSLLDNGIASGINVGLYLSKSINAVAAIFGVLKTGGAYVPLDPDSPIERIEYIIRDCNINFVIVDDFKLQKVMKNHLLFPEQFTIINLSNLEVVSTLPNNWNVVNLNYVEEQPIETPKVISHNYNPDSLAFILYTSGSTGSPKGVMISHKNARAFIDWSEQTIDLNENDVFSSHAPFHFDLSVFDIYVTFKVGGTLCLIPPGISYFPDALLDFIYKNRISVWYSVPSALKQLLGFDDELKEKLQSINTLIFAGEVFPYKKLNNLKKYLSNCKIYNFYGPTETNVITYYKLDNNSPDLLDNLPIGTSCSYADIKIVDNDKPVKQGKIGELVVNGNSLMKGYWGDIPKTESAIRKLIINNKEGYYYFTGDYVYEKPDGNIHYVNRKDNMVKTRGFRVELGEIENVFLKNESIQQIAVIAIDDNEIGKRLFAFVSLEEKKNTIYVEELEDYCSKYLPLYMIPSKIFILDDLPLTSTGKIDRKKLERNL